VGGDDRKEGEAIENGAASTDGGQAWTRVNGLGGFGSVVRYVPGVKPPAAIAVGPSGADYTLDDGGAWQRIEGPGYDASSLARSGRIGCGIGAGARIGRLQW